MAEGATDHRHHPSSSPLPLFIDTNLDTHLAMLASPDDTVADLKGKIMTEHALCFPKFGKVAIQAVKVKHGVSFYHLSDSILVKFAFSGIKGSWFLHLYLELLTSVMKSQMETDGVIMSENNGQPEEQIVLQTNRNLSLLLVTGEDRNQEFVANGMAVEEGRIQTSAPIVHESETYPDTIFQKPSAQGDLLLPNVSSPQNQSLHVSSNELDKRPDPHAPETELVTESDAVVGSTYQEISRQVAADHGVEADADVRVADSKKEKTRKRSSALQNDQLPDGKSAIFPCSRKRSKNEKDVSSKHNVADSSVKAADKENIDETSGNSNDELSKASGVALNDADISNKIAMESGIPSEITVKCSQHSRKKKSKKSDLPNAQSNTHETANSSIDQVPEVNQNKASSTSKELPSKKLKGAAVHEDAAAAGNSAVVESTFPSNPSDKKKNCKQKKREKIEPHHKESNMQSSIHETLDTSRDQVIEEFSNETSVRDLEHPGNESKQAAVLGEAVGNSTTVPSNPNEKKSKRSRKKSEKIELPSGEAIMAESVHPLTDKATEGNPRESLEDYQNETSGSHLRHAGKRSEETAVLSNSSTVDLLVPLSPSDKKSKLVKKSGKTELPRKEFSKDDAVLPLVKVTTKENPGVKFDGITTGIGENSKSLTTLREAAGVENTAELDLVITLSADGKNSCHKGKKNDGPPVIDHLSSSYDLDCSLASDPTQENLKKVSWSTSRKFGENLEKIWRYLEKVSRHKFNARVSSDETDQNMDHMNPSNLSSTGLNDSSDQNETGHLSGENAIEGITTGLQKAHEKLDMENVQDTVDNGSAEFIEAKDHGELPKSDGGKLDFLKIFDPKANQLEPSPELPSLETETKKTSKEKTNRKKKLNPSPQDSTNLLKPPVYDEQHAIPKKPQDSDSGKHNLSDPAEQIAKEELLSSKKHNKKDANRTHKLDAKVPDRSYDVGSPRRSNDVVKPGKKRQNYESKTYFQASLSSVDDGSKYPNGKNSMRTGSNLQSLRDNEGNDIMVSESEVPKHKNFNSYVGSRPGGVPVTQNSSNAATNVPVEEDMDNLVTSSDSTHEDTPVVQKRYRVAVRKVPKNRSAKVPHKFNDEKTTLAPSATIFNDGTSGSSDDEFEIRNRKAPEKSTSDNSSTYADSDDSIEETQTSYKNSPGSESMDSRKIEQKNNGAQSGLTKSSNAKTKGKPLGMILKSTGSYKKAKLSASLSRRILKANRPM